MANIAGGNAASIGPALIVPILRAVPGDTVSRANNRDAIYFIDPAPGYTEIRHYDRDVFGA
jgi:hypothetical protein